MPRRVLVTWIGNADLIAYSRLGGPSKKDLELIHELVPASNVVPRPGASEGIGPVKALIDKQPFAETHLIGNYENALIQHFGKWLNVRTFPHQVNVSNPSDHSQIYEAVKPILEGLKLEREDELCFHLSPGTPSAHAIWVLLGKSLYPATFFQTYNE